MQNYKNSILNLIRSFMERNTALFFSLSCFFEVTFKKRRDFILDLILFQLIQLLSICSKFKAMFLRVQVSFYCNVQSKYWQIDKFQFFKHLIYFHSKHQ
jgi:hypothetical protein